MEKDNYLKFEHFIRDRKSDLKRIAYKTKGEHEPSDVENIAWMMAQDMRLKKGIAIDFQARDDQELLLSHVYQKLVRYTETHFRHAVRLDHGQPGNDDEEEHPLMRTLASNDGRNPLTELMVREADRSGETDACHSLAGAYAYLLYQFDNKMQAVADFLLISVSEARRHCAYALWLAQHQFPIPLHHMENFRLKLKPWRRFRFQRIPVQLELPLVLAEELALDHAP